MQFHLNGLSVCVEMPQRRISKRTLSASTAIGLGLGGLIPSDASAQTMDLSIELPRLRVAEYHRPYVAVWLEKEGSAPQTLSIWYDVEKRGGGGTKWLHDVRQWWRAAGRSMHLPADGISGATRAPGVQKLRLTAGQGGMPALTPGSYTLMIEAAREVGGRELIRLPFTWKGSSATAAAKGASELGAVSFTLKR